MICASIRASGPETQVWATTERHVMDVGALDVEAVRVGVYCRVRLADASAGQSHCPFVIGQPPSSMSAVAIRSVTTTGGSNRSISSTALAISDRSASNASSCSGCCSRRARRCR